MLFRIFLKSFNKNKIEYVYNKLLKELKKESIEITSSFSLPIKIKRFCVLRSPQRNKDSREQFEIRFYKKIIDLEDCIKLIDINFELPLDVNVSIKKIE
jgi:small subunit ribosomal protein S10